MIVDLRRLHVRTWDTDGVFINLKMACYREADINRATATAVKKLGYSELRAKQALVVKKFVHGQDVFVSLPTGSGKSLCYCILPTVFDGLRGVEGLSIVVVVSPLIALTKDQVQAMTRRGVKAVYVGECEDDKAIMDVCSGNFQLVYMSPESLLTDIRWRDMLQSPIYRENLIGLVVDEAHCVKKW